MDCIICHNNVGKLSYLSKKGLTYAKGRNDKSVSDFDADGIHAIHETIRNKYLRPITDIATMCWTNYNRGKRDVFSSVLRSTASAH